MTTDTSTFNQKIKKEIDEGFGFVPFVGSGISANSGILMSQEFHDYLAYCVWKVMGAPTFREEIQPGSLKSLSDLRIKKTDTSELQHWSLIRNGWPALPTREEIKQSQHFLIACLNEDLELTGESFGFPPENLSYVFNKENKIADIQKRAHSPHNELSGQATVYTRLLQSKKFSLNKRQTLRTTVILNNSKPSHPDGYESNLHLDASTDFNLRSPSLTCEKSSRCNIATYVIRATPVALQSLDFV